MHGVYQKEIYKGGGKDSENEFWSTPAIKENAKRQNKGVFLLVWHKVISQQEQRQHIHKKGYTSKNQGLNRDGKNSKMWGICKQNPIHFIEGKFMLLSSIHRPNRALIPKNDLIEEVKLITLDGVGGLFKRHVVVNVNKVGAVNVVLGAQFIIKIF